MYVFSIHKGCFLRISAFEEMWGFLVFVSDVYSESIRVMGEIHYFLSGGDFDAEFSFERWKLIFQLRFL